MIVTILSVQPRLASAGGGLSPDEIVLQKALEFRESLPPLFDEAEAEKSLFAINSQGLIPSMSTVLRQELEKFNKLTNKMTRSL